MSYAMQVEQVNRILLHLESKLAQTLAEGQHRDKKYKAMLYIKVKLEAEIGTYNHLLEDILDNSNSVQSSQKTMTRKMWTTLWYLGLTHSSEA